jgi:hypothetical protein
VWRCNALQSTGVKLEIVRHYQNAGNAELHGSERWGTIHLLGAFNTDCPQSDSSKIAEICKMMGVICEIDCEVNAPESE